MNWLMGTEGEERPGHGPKPGQKGTAGGTHGSRSGVIMRNSRNTEVDVQKSPCLQ